MSRFFVRLVTADKRKLASTRRADAKAFREKTRVFIYHSSSFTQLCRKIYIFMATARRHRERHLPSKIKRCTDARIVELFTSAVTNRVINRLLSFFLLSRTSRRGAGLYVLAGVGGCGASGDGDVMMRFLPCYQAVESMRLGATPKQAAADAMVGFLSAPLSARRSTPSTTLASQPRRGLLNTSGSRALFRCS